MWKDLNDAGFKRNYIVITVHDVDICAWPEQILSTILRAPLPRLTDQLYWTVPAFHGGQRHFMEPASEKDSFSCSFKKSFKIDVFIVFIAFLRSHSTLKQTVFSQL